MDEMIVIEWGKANTPLRTWRCENAVVGERAITMTFAYLDKGNPNERDAVLLLPVPSESGFYTTINARRVS